MPDASPPRSRFAFLRQIRLRTLFLLTAAVAVWVGYRVNQGEIARLRQQVQSLRPLAHELQVDDPAQIAVVKCIERWYDENIWELYLPRPVRVCVATREIDPNGPAPPIAKELRLSAGRHRLELRIERNADKSWTVLVLTDGGELLRIDEPAEWNIARGSSGGGDFSQSKQLPADGPVELFDRTFMVETTPGTSSTPTGPANGLRLWLAPDAN